MCFVFHALEFDDIMTFEYLKFDYLRNEKNFRSKTENIFPCFTSTLSRHAKQISKNVVDTTFKLCLV